jgi:predicted Zn-dependent peptidase
VSFDERQVLDWAARRLAGLPKVSNRAPIAPQRGDFASRNYTGFASEPRVALLAFTDGLTGEDYFAHTLLEHLLDTRLFERLRLEAALAYTPAADLYSESDWGLFMIQADAEKDEQEEALDIINELVAELVDAPLPTEDFRAAQLSLLRSWAQSVETNAGYANYYISSHPTFGRDGRFLER